MKYLLLGMLMLSACGKPGEPGAPGKDGVSPQVNPPLTMVKLCPGTTVYPSKFIEVAFCVQGRLYGTYSDHGGFSTELPPGSYGSNGINASCNFIIQPNCVVVSQ